MAKTPTSASIVASDRMNPLPALPRRARLQAAIGPTADGKGPILLPWKAKPKKVVFGLLTEAGI